MHIEEIGEPIAVVAAFQGGKPRPLRFQWSGRSHHVDAVNADWEDREGAHRIHAFSVQAGGSTYHIHLRSKDMVWILDKVVLDG